MRPEAEGIVYPPVPFRVDPARVRAFGTVFGADGVFPTFPTAAEFTVFPDVLADPRLDLDVPRIVHGTQEYAFERPLREGEELVIHVRIGSARVRAGTGFLTIVTELREPAGALVVTSRSTMIERADA
jgi:N-terminal half of MaoC dehydratase